MAKNPYQQIQCDYYTGNGAKTQERLRKTPKPLSQREYDELALVAILVVVLIVTVLVILVVAVLIVVLVILVVAVLIVVSHDGASFRTFCLQGLFWTKDEENIRA